MKSIKNCGQKNKMEDVYFFDTYALVEIVKGNPKYAVYKYTKPIITIFNLVEIHYKLLRDFDKKIATKLIEKYADYVVDIDREIIKEANEFKLLYRNKNFSFTDVIGYITAQRYGVKFLTGDKQFKNMQNVKFVR